MATGSGFRVWVLRLGVLALALLGAAALAAWLIVRASLPPLDGVQAVSGLSADASIERDDHGIPTIRAATRPDLAFATGFAHAQDRYFQMDLIRRRAAGELSALIGPATLEADKANRFHRFRYRAEEAVRQLAEADRALLAAYAAGANAGLKSLGAKPFEYWLLGAEPEPWRAEDSILVLFAMFLTLNDDDASRDVRRSFPRRVFSDAVYDWLYPDGSPWDAPLMGAPRTATPLPPAADLSLRGVRVRRESAAERGTPPLPGSNNWAVSGALTATGEALVANDMHLGIGVPNIYYQARLETTDASAVDIAGVTLPGAPFVVAGSNRHMAWGYTNSYGDWTDAVLLEPGDAPDTYRTPEGDRAFELHVERIDVRGGAPVEHLVRETIWGPVLDIAYPYGDIAVSWTAHHVEAINLNIVRLETAETVAEALDIATTMGIPPQNFVAGDRAGSIGWTIAGRIPLKSGFDPGLPADWSDGAGWTGWLEPAAYPRLLNPPSGRLWTANSRVADGAALELIGDGGYDRGARARQIRDGLLQKERFAAADMLAIQIDDRALFLGRWRDLLVDLLDAPGYRDDPLLAEYRALAENWLPRAAASSVGYRLVRSFRLETEKLVWDAIMAPVREVYGDDLDTWRSPQFETALWQLVSERPEHLLPADFDSWEALLVAAVRNSISYYDECYGSPLTERSWGERNTARIQHPLSLAVPALSRWLDMPREPLNGDVDLPLAQSPTFGASERFAVSPGDRENGILHMPTGQSGHPLSEFYRRGHRDWVEGLASPFLPGPAEHRLLLSPAE